MPINSKKVIANVFLDLCRKNRIKDITIQQIAEASDISRKTFYNHFCDKQEVVEWIWLNNFTDALIEFEDFSRWSKRSSRVFEKDWWFYKQVIRDTDFWEWHKNWLYQSMCNYIRVNYPDELTEEVKYSIRVWLAGTCSNEMARHLINSHGTPVECSVINMNNMPLVLQRFFPKRDDKNCCECIYEKDERFLIP